MTDETIKYREINSCRFEGMSYQEIEKAMRDLRQEAIKNQESIMIVIDSDDEHIFKKRPEITDSVKRTTRSYGVVQFADRVVLRSHDWERVWKSRYYHDFDGIFRRN